MAARVADLRPADGYVRWRRRAALPDAGADVAPRTEVEIAVLATFTTDLLNELLPVAGWVHSLRLRVRTVPYGQLEQALWDPTSPVCRQPPRYVVLAGTPADVRPEDVTGGDDGTATRLVYEAVERWTALWDRASALGIQVIQLGFVPPAVDPLCTVGGPSAGSVTLMVNDLNTQLAARAGAGVRFVDVSRLATQLGLSRWSDPRCWYRLRQPFGMEALPWLAAAIAEAVAVDAGVTRRCVVVDLDNTLWGGVVGQDGIHGLVLADGADGEAYRDFQRYLRELAGRGVVLAVCSKNDQELGEQAIGEVPGMVLRRTDFAAISCGWGPKSRQILTLARRLHLGVESMVFVDDDAAECAEVAAALPDVAVVHLTGGPSTFPAAVSAVPGLAAGGGAADVTRMRSYAALARADELRDRTRDLDTHLRALEMTARVAPVDSAALPRVAELVAKTNQFNLTTRRRTEAELAGMLSADGWFAAYLRLGDRFADHGLVGVVIATVDGAEAEIDTLVLSCRVIGRTAERNLVAAAARWASSRGAVELVGRYLPTTRNGLVRDVYTELGFERGGETPSGARTFRYDLTRGCPPASPYLRMTEDLDAR